MRPQRQIYPSQPRSTVINVSSALVVPELAKAQSIRFEYSWRSQPGRGGVR
jgi:hypothetical protein